MTVMQGTLWKWTNYISGWQPRWFVLEAGILSYYLSHDEVTQGSRGALKVISCNVNVNRADDLRMHIVTPDRRYIYLKAASVVERQKWLLAIARSKQQCDPPLESGQADASRPVKTKMTELRENCDHLLTQIGNIKAASNQSPPDVKSLEALSSTLTITCDDFLQVLQDCMELCHSSDVPVTPVGMGGSLNSLGVTGRHKKGSISDDESRSSTKHSHTPSPNHTPPTKHKRATPIPATTSLPFHLLDSRASESPDKRVTFENELTEKMSDSTNETTPGKMSSSVMGSPTSESKVSNSSRTHSRSNSDLFLTPISTPIPSPPPSPPSHPDTLTSSSVRERATTVNGGQSSLIEGNADVLEGEGQGQERTFESFFSRIDPKYGDILLVDGDQIPTKVVLDCCKVVLPFFDTLSPTAFAPLKADINGNIVRIEKKYETDPDLYPTLQSIVEREIETNSAGSESASEAMLWLKRAMEFIYQFIGEIANGEQALDIAAGKAYSKSLRRHHNWMVRGIFSLAVRALPYYSDLIVLLGSDGTEESEEQVLKDMKDFSQCLGEICAIVDRFLIESNIETEG